MKNTNVTISGFPYTLNYEVDKDNCCKLISLVDDKGVDYKDQVDEVELNVEIEKINTSLQGAADGSRAIANGPVETPATEEGTANTQEVQQ